MRLRSSLFAWLLRQCRKALNLPASELKIPPVFNSETYQAPPGRSNAIHILVGNEMFCLLEYSTDIRESPVSRWETRDLDSFLRQYMLPNIENLARKIAVLSSEVPVSTLLREGRFGELQQKQDHLIQALTSRLESYMRSKRYHAMRAALKLAR